MKVTFFKSSILCIMTNPCPDGLSNIIRYLPLGLIVKNNQQSTLQAYRKVFSRVGNSCFALISDVGCG